VIWAITASVGVVLNAFLLKKSYQDLQFVRRASINGLSKAIATTRLYTDLNSMCLQVLSLILALLQMDTAPVVTAYGPVHAQWLSHLALYVGAGVPIAAWEIATLIVVAATVIRFVYRVRIDVYLGRG